ncbi:MAG: type II toxin-antitoxin system VapC family toxin [Thermomicrobiales bacterium]|nr:type II toxin-antitoxin system VapC family toxin [Thermomicrobiales bacterium]
MLFIDTNTFVYLLTGSPADRAERVRALFVDIEGGLVEATTSESVIAEVVYVLSSKANFGLPRRIVARSIRDILLVDGLIVPEAGRIHAATQWYESTRLDWVDCLAVAQMQHQGITEIASYDRHFDRIEGIVRVEP